MLRVPLSLQSVLLVDILEGWQVGLRKDGPASVEFYTKHLGMTLLRKVDFPQYKFSLHHG